MNAEIGAVGACNLVLLHPLVHEAWVGREADWDSADGRLAYTSRRMYFRFVLRTTIGTDSVVVSVVCSFRLTVSD